MHTTGLTDSPAIEDMFGITEYIDGLTTFVLECDTPMTISIQGSWGSGKTSVMNMVKENKDIKEKVITVFFNTWQFSQFEMGNQLPLSMVKFFLNEIQSSIPYSDSQSQCNHDRILALVNWFRKFCKKNKIQTKSELKAETKKSGIVLAKVLVNAITRATSAGWLNDPFPASEKIEQRDLAKAIKDLKEALQSAVDEACMKTGKEKIVVFIDDLDRLEPRKAMELLEVLKIFFDCKKCVFLLAIDYDVVIRGAAEKYGFKLNSDFALSDKEAEQNLKEAEKGRAFFDKIIQVPFKMPTVEYNITKYLRNGLEKINISPNEDDMPKYKELCDLSLGTNPRALKRILNAFLLLNTIRAKNQPDHNKSQQQLILFGLLCLQQYREGIYNLIVKVNKEIDLNATEALSLITILCLSKNSSTELNNLYRTDFSEHEIISFRPFFEFFLSLLDIYPEKIKFLLSDKGALTADEEKLQEEYQEKYQLLCDLLKLSATTSKEDNNSDKEFESNLDELTDVQLSRYNFWSRLKEVAYNDPDFIKENMKFNRFRDEIWIGFASGSSKLFLQIRQARREKKCLVTYFCKKDFYQEIYPQRDKIHEALNFELKWTKPTQTTLNQKYLSANYEIKNVDFEDDEALNPVYSQLIKALVSMKMVIKRYI